MVEASAPTSLPASPSFFLRAQEKDQQQKWTYRWLLRRFDLVETVDSLELKRFGIRETESNVRLESLDDKLSVRRMSRARKGRRRSDEDRSGSHRSKAVEGEEEVGSRAGGGGIERRTRGGVEGGKGRSGGFAVGTDEVVVVGT